MSWTLYGPVGYFILLNGPLNGHPPSYYYAASMHHKDASAIRMKIDENDVNKTMHTIESWVNPFK